MTRYRTVFDRINRRRPLRAGRGAYVTPPCPFCPSPDARDAAHQSGCPTLPALSKRELVAIARNVEAGWKAAAAERPKVRGAGA